jgi:hypothetical protein
MPPGGVLCLRQRWHVPKQATAVLDIIKPIAVSVAAPAALAVVPCLAQQYLPYVTIKPPPFAKTAAGKWL